MKNMSKNLELEKRKSTFLEVDLGYDLNQVIKESNRCLGCKNPLCENACPVNIKIKDFISFLKNKDIDKAYLKIVENNLLPSICGRVCPQEKQCEKNCLLGIKGQSVAIGKLERFVGDYHEVVSDDFKGEKNGIQVGVIGSGPSGISCAIELAKNGFDVTIFEALHEIGGVLAYGIPEFRLPKAVVKKELNLLKTLGIKIFNNMVVGKTIYLSDLRQQGFKEFFVATGAGLPNKLNIEGENLCGVEYANGFLTRVNLMRAYDFLNYDTPINVGQNIGVIGAGNVALDAARTAIRLKAAHVYIIYRRSMEEAPARQEELEHAFEEGIQFLFLHNPVKIIGKDKIEEVLLEKMVLVEDGKNRKKPMGTGKFISVQLDHLIIAVGQSANPTFFQNHTVETNKWGNIIVDEKGKTSIDDLYAGGDIVTGAATVISAMGAGKIAAKSIIEKYSKSK